MTYTLHCGDCLKVLPGLQPASVDAIIADPPYGTTACKWDSVIPLAPMWAELKRVIKPRGAIVLFAAQPFNHVLWDSNRDNFRYEWIWDKVVPSGMSYARFQPMRQHEYVLVFSQFGTMYNPQMITRDKPIKEGGKRPSDSAPIKYFNDMGGKEYTHKFPSTILECLKIRQNSLHPTQKPVDLLRYLVLTYTNAGETVLDFTMGSGTTGVACQIEQRNFIGVELDAGYFEIAKRRIEQVQPSLMGVAA